MTAVDRLRAAAQEVIYAYTESDALIDPAPMRAACGPYLLALASAVLVLLDACGGWCPACCSEYQPEDCDACRDLAASAALLPETDGAP